MIDSRGEGLTKVEGVHERRKVGSPVTVISRFDLGRQDPLMVLKIGSDC